METTFDKFITGNPEQKALFDKEYADFVRAEMLIFENRTKERQANSLLVQKRVRRTKEYAFN